MDGILNQLTDILNPQATEKLATVLGSDVANALPRFCPLLAAQLYNYLKSGQHPADFLRKLHDSPEFNASNTESILAGGIPPLLTSIFNGQTNKAVEVITNAMKISDEKAISMLKIAGTMVLGVAGKYLRNRNAQSISLVGWLETQLPQLRAVAPATLGEVDGVAPAVGAAAATAATATATATTEPRVAQVKSTPVVEKRRKIWPWILLLLLLACLLFLMRGCKTETHTTVAPTAPVEQTTAAPATTDEPDTWSLSKVQLGDFFKKQLPNNVTLDIPQNGIENHLIAHIESNDPVSDNLWFSFDRLVFKTSSAVLEPQSEEQLNNIANILRAWPNVKFKLGGYTDNTGSEEFNMKLSQQRADSVRLSLIERGIQPDRIVAKGYGSAHPVVPNDTAENRARNRRIDVNVMEK